ncbi:hypothetical protein GUJ93_ZPchr0013g37569 [Zizania palustris]|uniref:Uncharacterized protein n=1 Tax=Zizania palustris TaxID=103762 RepID=A0A8J5WWY7_ZIZPA|nr:hypothetical protein GUJ93_ZPchr0013g37569 [Zizania palustris]
MGGSSQHQQHASAAGASAVRTAPATGARSRRCWLFIRAIHQAKTTTPTATLMGGTAPFRREIRLVSSRLAAIHKPSPYRMLVSARDANGHASSAQRRRGAAIWSSVRWCSHFPVPGHSN